MSVVAIAIELTRQATAAELDDAYIKRRELRDKLPVKDQVALIDLYLCRRARLEADDGR